MAVSFTNAYGTEAQLKAELGIDDLTDDAQLTVAGNAAARQIDYRCGRRHGFWQDATVKTRTYVVDDAYCCDVDDISTTAGLIVKTDTGLNGGYATTQTIVTNFYLAPLNADQENPVRPFNQIVFVDGAYVPMSSYRRATLQVTAKFGWPAVPDPIAKAWLIQAVQLFKASAAVFGGIQLSPELGGVLRVSAQLNPMAEALIQDFIQLQ